MDSKKVGSVMVIGGGIAGIQSSLDLADLGYKVFLLEDSPAIGGTMAQLDKTFPTTKLLFLKDLALLIWINVPVVVNAQ